MRVVMIGPFAWSPKGTVSARAFLIARALVGRGHQAIILMPPYDNLRQAGFQWELDGVELINVPFPSRGDSLWARLIVPFRMAHRVKKFKPDLVHVFKPLGYAGLTGMHIRLLWPKLPLVLDSDDWEGRGGWADANPYPLHWRWFFDWQEKWLARRADVVTVASRTLESRMWGLGLKSESVFYLPNGPHPLYREHRYVSQDARRELRQAIGVGAAPLALYIGHISYESEVSLIVEALPLVLQEITDFRVVIMGSGAGLPRLQQLAVQMGIGEHLIFTGWVAPEETPVYLAAADLALYPYRDTLVNRAKSPSKITAYMAMGKPIVAGAVGEIIGYLDGGRAGVLVQPGDAHAFANGIVALLKDPQRATELGRQAEELIWERYDWTQQVSRLEATYESAMGHVSWRRGSADLPVNEIN